MEFFTIVFLTMTKGKFPGIRALPRVLACIVVDYMVIDFMEAYLEWGPIGENVLLKLRWPQEAREIRFLENNCRVLRPSSIPPNDPRHYVRFRLAKEFMKKRNFTLRNYVVERYDRMRQRINPNWRELYSVDEVEAFLRSGRIDRYIRHCLIHYRIIYSDPRERFFELQVKLGGPAMTYQHPHDAVGYRGRCYCWSINQAIEKAMKQVGLYDWNNSAETFLPKRLSDYQLRRPLRMKNSHWRCVHFITSYHMMNTSNFDKALQAVRLYRSGKLSLPDKFDSVSLFVNKFYKFCGIDVKFDEQFTDETETILPSKADPLFDQFLMSLKLQDFAIIRIDWLKTNIHLNDLIDVLGDDESEITVDFIEFGSPSETKLELYNEWPRQPGERRRFVLPIQQKTAITLEEAYKYNAELLCREVDEISSDYHCEMYGFPTMSVEYAKKLFEIHGYIEHFNRLDLMKLIGEFDQYMNQILQQESERYGTP